MDKEKKGKKLATEHVDWFLSTIRPLLISHFEHGYKHGVECDKSMVVDNKIEISTVDVDYEYNDYVDCMGCDDKVASIAERMGFRPEVACRRIRELEEFIRNGVEFGYISVPEKGDKAREIIEGIM